MYSQIDNYMYVTCTYCISEKLLHGLNKDGHAEIINKLYSLGAAVAQR
jgi:hypothetical protein